MNVTAWIACLLLATAFPPVAVSVAHSQAVDSAPKPEPYFLNLYPPAYPPLARQARIGGDVILKIEVRPDGSVASAAVISGHAMLKQAALESAVKSTFPRPEGAEGAVSYLITYTFGLRRRAWAEVALTAGPLFMPQNASTCGSVYGTTPLPSHPRLANLLVAS